MCAMPTQLTDRIHLLRLLSGSPGFLRLVMSLAISKTPVTWPPCISGAAREFKDHL